jgi:hypothetical protein
MSFTKTVNTYQNGEPVSEIKTFAVGTTLKVYYDYVQVMSDEWASVKQAKYWDGQSVKTEIWVEDATVDATPDVLAAVENFYYKHAVEVLVEAAKAEALAIKTESVVKVIAGRDNKGVSGKVVVKIERPYSMGYRSVLATKLGIATSEDKINVIAKNGKTYSNYKDVVWAWARNVVLVSPPEPDLSEVEEIARDKAKRSLKEVYKAA